VSAVRFFTAREFAEVAGLPVARAEEFLEGFEQAGLVQRKLRGWTVTPAGLLMSRELGLVVPERTTRAA